MKFTNGYWLLKDEMKAVYAVEYASHRVMVRKLQFIFQAAILQTGEIV